MRVTFGPCIRYLWSLLDYFSSEGNQLVLVVLTGDIVDSTSMSKEQLDSVFSKIEQTASIMETFASIPLPLERFRGDGWQFVLPSMDFSLRAALLFRAAIKCVDRTADTRISIGAGKGVLSESVSSSEGKAFLISGRGLDEMSRGDRFSVVLEDELSSLALLSSAVFNLCEAISGAWTSRQAEVFFRLVSLSEPAFEAVADDLEITVRGLRKTFSQGDGPALLNSILLFERAWQR